MLASAAGVPQRHRRRQLSRVICSPGHSAASASAIATHLDSHLPLVRSQRGAARKPAWLGARPWRPWAWAASHPPRPPVHVVWAAAQVGQAALGAGCASAPAPPPLPRRPHPNCGFDARSTPYWRRRWAPHGPGQPGAAPPPGKPQGAAASAHRAVLLPLLACIQHCACAHEARSDAVGHEPGVLRVCCCCVRPLPSATPRLPRCSRCARPLLTTRRSVWHRRTNVCARCVARCSREQQTHGVSRRAPGASVSRVAPQKVPRTSPARTPPQTLPRRT